MSSSSCFLTNPYNPDGSRWEDLAKITARVDPVDLAYLRRLLPFRHGVLDKILSTIFQHYINELRTLEQSNGVPFEPAFFPEHPTELVISNLLSRLRFSGLEGGTVGVGAGGAGEGPCAQHEPGGDSSVHLPVQSPTAVRSVQESGSD